MDTSQEPMTIKVVVIGDESVGKTGILLTYTLGEYPTGYVPTQFENYTTQVSVDSMNVNLSLWDTNPLRTYNRLKYLSYGQADIFIIVFSVIDSNTFDNALKECDKLNANEFINVPKIFVGNKIDIRNNDDPKHIKSEAAIKVVQEKNCPYFECSALTSEGIKPLFDLAATEAIKAKSKQKSQELSQALSNQPKEKKKKKGCNIQ